MLCGFWLTGVSLLILRKRGSDEEVEPIGAAQLHVCRTVCRRAERLVVALQDESEATRSTIAYLNRLSDYLFVAARFANHDAGVEDVPWKR